ncbi:MAG: hypothetical protein ACREF3_10800, partial [Acetobacteraceae bacterium]
GGPAIRSKRRAAPARSFPPALVILAKAPPGGSRGYPDARFLRHDGSRVEISASWYYPIAG